MSKIKLKPNTAISRSGFIGFVVMMLWTFVMEILPDETGFTIPPVYKFIIYVIGYGVVVIFSVDKPDVKKFLITVKDAISDGQLTNEEIVSIIKSAWFVLLGWFADINRAEEERRAIPEDIEPIDLSKVLPLKE